MTGRGAGRARRAALLAALGALVAVVALLRGTLPAPPAAAPPPVPPVDPTGAAVRVVDVDLNGPRTGYGLLTQCRGGSGTAPSRCRALLSVTLDGLRWERRPTPLPEYNGNEQDVGEVVALPTGVLLVAYGPPRQAWTSRNAGRTWTPAPTVPDGAVDEVPSGAVLRTGCVDATCATAGPLAVLPDGTRATLPAVPDLVRVSAVGVPVDGARVLVGAVPGTGVPAVATSRDGAQSWTVAALPSTPDARGVEVSGRDGVLYAVVTRAGPAGPDVSELHRSDDGGATWTRALGLVPGSGPVLGPVAVADDGRVVLSTRDGAWTSTDGGRTVLPGATVAGWRSLRLTAGGYVALPATGPPLRSADGSAWTELAP